ncbi:cytochrome P450 [Bisporella sp. PMI_857]|nr:cytochrome P450 [Bisporella sp. PMI_857]
MWQSALIHHTQASFCERAHSLKILVTMDFVMNFSVSLDVPAAAIKLPKSYIQRITESSAFNTKVHASAVGLALLFALLSRKWLAYLSKAISRRIEAWKYLFWGPDIIQTAYDKANGKPFEILAPDSRYVFVSQPKHIHELNSAPDTVLSLQAASKQMLQPKYTMHGFNWFNVRGTEGVGFIKALRTLLTNNMPSILPDLRFGITENLNQLIESHPVVDGSRHSPLYPMIVKLTVLTNCHAFFGKELSTDSKFLEYALGFIEDTLMTAELVRLLPEFLAAPIGNGIARRLKSHKVLFNTLVPIAQERIEEKKLKQMGQKVEQHHDCIQWIMETSPPKNPWTAERIVHELMAIWFGSVHALSTTISFAIHDICIHKQYVAPLRREISSPEYAQFERTGKGLPLLDSFIKESARLTPVESMSTRRYALEPFSLSDGTKVHVGDWACTPVRALMTNPEFYPEPNKFRPFRFVDPELLAVDLPETSRPTQPNKASNFTDVNLADGSWHVWGTGRMACPGRFYASAIIKIMLAQIIATYDVELVDKEAPRYFTWRSSMLPKAKTMVVFAPRV